MTDSNNLNNHFEKLTNNGVSELINRFYANERINRALSDIASNRVLKEAIDKAGGVFKIEEAIKDSGINKLQETIENSGGLNKIEDALKSLNIKSSTSRTENKKETKTNKFIKENNDLSTNKWEKILSLKNDLDNQIAYLTNLNSRSLVAFSKRAEAEKEVIIKDCIDEILSIRKKNVQDSLNDRIQLNFRLSDRDTKKVNEIQNWIKNKGNIPILDQELNTEKIDTPSSLARELLNLVIEYLYIASLNDRQLEALAEMIVRNRQIFNYECREVYDEAHYNGHPITDSETGHELGFPEFQRRYEKDCKKLIIQTSSCLFDMPEKLIEQNFWPKAEKRADEIIKELEEGEPLDKTSKLRAKILKDFNQKIS